MHTIKPGMRILTLSAIFLAFPTSLVAEIKVDRNVSYGPHPSNVMDVY